MAKTITIPDEVDEILTSIAAKENIPKGEIVDRLVDNLRKEKETKRKKMDELFEALNKKDEKEGGEMDFLDKMAMYKMFMKEDSGTPVQSVNPITEMMQMAMGMMAMKSMMQPDYAQQVQLLQAMKGGNEDEVKRIQEDIKNEQKAMMERIERMMSDKKSKDEIAEIKKLITEKKADEGLEKLRSTLDERLKPSERKSLAEELKDNVVAWNALKDFARATGMTDKQMTTPEGKVNWGAIADKVLDTVKTFAERMPTQPGKQQELAEVPLTGDVDTVYGEPAGVEHGAQGEVILRGEPPAQGSGEATPPATEVPPAGGPPAEAQSTEAPPGAQSEAPAPSDEIAPVQSDTETKQKPPSQEKQEVVTPEEKHVCQEPGCDFEAKTISGLLSHTRSKHPAKVNKLASQSPADDTTDSQPGGKRAKGFKRR